MPILGENPPDPSSVADWNTNTVPTFALDPERFAAQLAAGWGGVGEVTDVGQPAVWTADKTPYYTSTVTHAGAAGLLAPTMVDPDTLIVRNVIPIFWTYVPWPDDDHAIDGAEWIRRGLSAVHGWERPGDVTYLRHLFWVPMGAITTDATVTLQFAGVDIVREVWLNGNQVYGNDVDYNTQFSDYTPSSLDVGPDAITPGQWNLLAIKYQHHVNIVETIVPPYREQAAPSDYLWDACAPVIHFETALFFDNAQAFPALAAATQLSFRLAMPKDHIAYFEFNSPLPNDLDIPVGTQIALTAGFNLDSAIAHTLGMTGPGDLSEWSYRRQATDTSGNPGGFANPYCGGIVFPMPYAPLPNGVRDSWPFGLRVALCVPPSSAFPVRNYVWEDIWYGPVHQLNGTTFRLDTSLDVADWHPDTSEEDTGEAIVTDAVQVYVTSGSNTAYILTGDGRVLGFGSGFGGALGNGSETDDFGTPITINVGGQPVARIMGGSGDTFTMFAVTYSGELWGWGLDELLTQTDSMQVNAVRILPSLLPAGSVEDVTVLAENAVFIRRNRVNASSSARAWAQVIGV